jgi:hypothetical protein
MTPPEIRQLRIAALVIAGGGALWLVSLWAIPALGLPVSYALLSDLAALAAFIWALAVAFRIWQRQRDAGK